MKYQTDLMRRILTNETAQKIIDYVSPIYGNSYVALWIYQAVGTALGEVCTIAEQLRYETTPATADLLLGYWEKQYKIPADETLTKEQRRNRIISKIQSRGACTPARIRDAVSSALGGVEVEIVENVAQNTFLVNIREHVEDITPAVAVLERMKPAHLVYQMQVALQIVSPAEIKVAIAMTHAEQYTVEVQQ